MNILKECFDTILYGNENDSRLAARKVRKLVYSSSANPDKYKDIKNLINNAPDNYARISEEWQQENFVTAISIVYFMHDREGQPDFLFPWLFQLLQHSNGVIRYAAVKMFYNEIGPLTVHIRISDYKPSYFGKLTPKQADTILYSLLISLDGLLSTLWQPKYKKYKYIESLPASPYKSVQMVLAELKESCGQEYINHFMKQPPNNMGLA